MKTRKKKTSVALDLQLLEWVDQLIQRKRFASRTHAIELGLQKMKEEYENESGYS